ncbi:MAG: hypothetical protein ACK4QW_19360 [Alphaproteobacteria bacterium]
MTTLSATQQQLLALQRDMAAVAQAEARAHAQQAAAEQTAREVAAREAAVAAGE